MRRDEERGVPMPEYLRKQVGLPPRSSLDLEELARRTRYNETFERLRRGLVRERAVAASVTIQYGAGRDEHKEAVAREREIGDELERLTQLHRAGAPLSVRTFPPLSGVAPKREDASPRRAGLFEPAVRVSVTEGFDDVLDQMG